MSQETPTQEIDQLAEALTHFRKRLESKPSEDNLGQNLQTAFEELQVAYEELRLQNEALAEAQDQLAEQRRHFQDLFKNAPDGYLLTDRQGVIQDANDEAARMLHVPARFLVGKPIVLFIAPLDRGAFH